MDQTIIDVSGLDRAINPGDHVVLIGTSQAAEITTSEFSDSRGNNPLGVALFHYETSGTYLHRFERNLEAH